MPLFICSCLAPKARYSLQPGATPTGSRKSKPPALKARFNYCAVSRAFSARLESNPGPWAMPQAVMTKRLWR